VAYENTSKIIYIYKTNIVVGII